MLSEDLDKQQSHVNICCLHETMCSGSSDNHASISSLLAFGHYYNTAVSSSRLKHIDKIELFGIFGHCCNSTVPVYSLLTIINIYNPISQQVNNYTAEQDRFFTELAYLTFFKCKILHCRRFQQEKNTGHLTVMQQAEY